MADVIGLSDVSTKDTGSGSKLKTGGRRSHNMPKECIAKWKAKGKTDAEAQKLCYPKKKKGKKINKGKSPSDSTNIDYEYWDSPIPPYGPR